MLLASGLLIALLCRSRRAGADGLDALKNTLASGRFDNLTWEGEFDENDETIAAVQNVRGFHTLEFLLFYNGKPRTLSK